MYQTTRFHVTEGANQNTFCTSKRPSLSPLGLQNDNLYEELEQCAHLSKRKLVLMMINGQTMAYAHLIKANVSLAKLRNRS